MDQTLFVPLHISKKFSHTCRFSHCEIISHDPHPPSLPPEMFFQHAQEEFIVLCYRLYCALLASHRGRLSLVGCCLWGRTESDTTEAT